MNDNIRKQTREMLQEIVNKSDINNIKKLAIEDLENRLYQITQLSKHYIHHVLYSNKD